MLFSSLRSTFTDFAGCETSGKTRAGIGVVWFWLGFGAGLVMMLILCLISDAKMLAVIIVSISRKAMAYFALLEAINTILQVDV